MFCPKCGLPQSNLACYCIGCGESLQLSAEKGNKRPMSLNDFMESKKKARTGNPKKTNVSVYCSPMKEGLRQDRGTRLPVLVDISWGAAELKKAIYEKMGRYHSHILDFRMSDYNLIYKTGEIIRFVIDIVLYVFYIYFFLPSSLPILRIFLSIC